jgi:PhzF family phenazine biosynthesis protein
MEVAVMRMRLVDAFAERPFAGNPACVCILESPEWPDDEWMLRVGVEMSQPMTAFARPPLRDGDAWGLRWFNTVPREEAYCGHATLATAHVLFASGAARDVVHFETRAGLLAARAESDGRVTLDFPAAALSPRDVLDGLVDALGGVQPIEVHGTGSLRDLLLVLDSDAAVRGVAPDLDALIELSNAHDVRGFIVTARAGEGADYDVVSRFFGPAEGYPEDSVTGSAHTAVAPYWASRLGVTRLRAVQASRRGGRIDIEVGDGRVHLTGRAITILDGEMLAAPAPATATA